MFVVLVYVHVKSDAIELFKEATLENARNSVQEAGVARFDFFQQADDPTRFVLVEVYRDVGAPARHKQTAHYAKWRSVAEELMAEPRTGVRYDILFPDEAGW
jgi:(4S)-4-hydroxy-5-phosphonooxypentane-2,3-dione isomerase